jgi:hypothetical protein
VTTLTGEDRVARLDDGEALGSAAGLAPAQPASTRTAIGVLAAARSHQRDHRSSASSDDC